MELLIVVAIISILFSILIPALRNVRNRAKSVNCISNLKQIHMISCNYADDNGGMIAPFYDGTYTWNNKLRILGYIGTPELMTCPGIYPHKYDPTNSSAVYGMLYLGGSCMSMNIFANPVVVTHAGGSVAYNSPSSALLFCDSIRDYGSKPRGQFYYVIPSGVTTIHSDYGVAYAAHMKKRINSIFADGHAEEAASSMLYKAKIRQYCELDSDGIFNLSP